jgi:hypothetical protein
VSEPIRKFFEVSVGSGLELGVFSADAVMRHFGPDILSAHLPRPLWAKLFAASLVSARLDAQLVVDTVGIPSLCEHMPKDLLWGCLADLAKFALGVKAAGGEIISPPPAAPRTTAAPPAASQPAAAAATKVAAAPPAPPAVDEGAAKATPRQAFRSTTTNAGQTTRAVAGATSRRPQATATPVVAPVVAELPESERTSPSVPRSAAASGDFEAETEARPDWKARTEKEELDDDLFIEWPAGSDEAPPAAKR